ncbi:MAG: hypothetical protein WAM97_10410 [Acidimicrobiales bacterium]
MSPDSPAGDWYQLACGSYNSASQLISWLTNLRVTYVPPQERPYQVAESAESTLTLPAPSIETNPAQTAIVNFPTWLWVDPAVWHVWTTTATAENISATAIATPVQIDFDMGDGSRVVCNGPGEAFDEQRPPAAQTTGCSYTYTRTSAYRESGVDTASPYFVVTAQILWDVTWVSVGEPGGGTLPPLTTTSSIDLGVEQIQSLGGL